MGKAAQRRRKSRKSNLVDLYKKDPARFEMAWEIRVQSWLDRISELADSWKKGYTDSRKPIFSILDEARDILFACEGLSPVFIRQSLELLNNECCTQVARIVDKRLYRLSNYDLILLKSKNGKPVKSRSLKSDLE